LINKAYVYKPEYIIYALIICFIAGIFATGKKLYIVYEDINHDIVELSGMGFYETGYKGRGRYLRIQSSIDPHNMTSIQMSNVRKSKKEAFLLKNINGSCIVVKGIETTLYDYIVLDIRTCNGEVIFKRGYDWFVSEYKTFSNLDMTILVFSIIGLALSCYFISYKLKN
jgi:hypothetical protein